MREILFRGKDKETGEWVEGYLYVRRDGVREISCYNKDFNIERWTSQVTNESVGQYTGLNDKNGNRIFEGDIVMKRTYHGKKPMKVVFSFGCFHCGFGGGSSTPSHPYTLDDGQIEVIGNIHDNPELLKEGK